MLDTQSKKMSKLKDLLLKSLASNSLPEHKYIQIATVSDGSPRCRTVVFRGFQETNLLIFTDKNSEKIKELVMNPKAEICWYFPISREQYRIRGQVSISNDSELVLNSWKSLSDNARKGFQDLPLDNVVADSFCVIVFSPCYAERLDLFVIRSSPVELQI
jgi:hypothetical protein